MSRRSRSKERRAYYAAKLKGKDVEKIAEKRARILHPNLEPVRTYPHGTSETVKRELMLRDLQRDVKKLENPSDS